MSFRLWSPQLDVYDAIRRAGILLLRWKSVFPTIERLQIMDFYFANPPLLHDVHMTSEMRKEFTAAEIKKPEKTFLSYPAAPILFHKMEPVQREALQTLIGKDLINRNILANGSVQLSEAGVTLFKQELANNLDAEEEKVCDFLINHFSKISAGDITDLRRRTGLRRGTK